VNGAPAIGRWPRLQERAAVPLAPGILSPRKDHSQGRTSSLRCGRSTLTVIFRGNIGAYRGGRSSVEPESCESLRRLLLHLVH
jgi:hypothetical protein